VQATARRRQPPQEVKPYNICTTILSPDAVVTELTQAITNLDITAGMELSYAHTIGAD